MIIQELTEIRHEHGFAYIARIGPRAPSSHRRPSSAAVLENDVPLPGPANALHKDIRAIGHGGYSFWHGYVYFAASDNSDPRTNGRKYSISFSRYESNPFANIIARVRDVRPRQFLWGALYWIAFLFVWLRGILGGTRLGGGRARG